MEMREAPAAQLAPRSSSNNIVKAGSTTYVYRFVGPQQLECLVPEDQVESKEFTFVRKVDPKSGREFFVNTLTRNRVWVLPDVAALAAMPPLPAIIDRNGTVFHLTQSAGGEKVYAPQHLPVPLHPGHCWLPRPDRIHLKYFFVNAATKEKVMFLPPTLEYMGRIELMFLHYHIDEAISIPEKGRDISSSSTSEGTPYEQTLLQWAGREVQVLAQLVLKYGAEPPRQSTVDDVVDAYVRQGGVSQGDIDAILQVVDGHSAQEQLDALREAFGVPPRTLRQRILSMYHHYAPEKLHQVEQVTNQYGQPHLPQMLEDLVSKWGAEPQDFNASIKSPRTAALATSKLEQRVVAMLAAYDPLNLHKAQEYLAVFQGNERELLENLVRRFGPEPTSSTSNGGAPPSSVGSLTPRSHSTQSYQLRSPEGELDNNHSAEGGGNATDNVFRERLVAFYRRYNPGKLSGVDETLRKYAGEEALMMDQLVRKYGPEPSSPLLGSHAAGRLVTSHGGSPSHHSSSSQPASFEASATEPPPANVVPLRERITAMYEVYSIEGELEKTLELYDGSEKKMLEALVGAYGPEPTLQQVQDARRIAQEQAASRVTRKRGQSLVDQTRTKISAILSKHDPEAITSVDQLLAQYQGREEQLVEELSDRYLNGNSSTQPTEAVIDPQDPVALEQIRQEIATKARAENRAFLERLNTSESVGDEEGLISPVQALPPSEQHAASPSQAQESTNVTTADTTAASSSSPQRKVRQVVTVTPAILPSDGGVGQLYAVERQLHEALDATERVLRRNEILHEENVRLSNTHRTLQQQCDGEVRVVKNELDKVRSDFSRMHHEFALEKVQLKMQEEGAILRFKQETQEEHAKYVAAHLETLSEKKQLEQLLMETKAALAHSDSQCRSFEMRIKRRDRELEDAQAEVKFLTIQLDKGNCTDSWTQTDQLLQWSPRSDKRHSLHKNDPTTPRSTTNEATIDVGQLRITCEELERELAIAKAKHREAMEECENAAKFIHVLKTKKRKLEERVAHLELRELALPDAPPSFTEVECRRLESEVTALQDQLAGADSQNRRCKREIAELRSLLSLHMAGSTPRISKKRSAV